MPNRVNLTLTVLFSVVIELLDSYLEDRSLSSIGRPMCTLINLHLHSEWMHKDKYQNWISGITPMLSVYRDTLLLLLDDDAISLRRCQQKPPPFEVSFSLAQLVEFLFFYYGRQIRQFISYPKWSEFTLAKNLHLNKKNQSYDERRFKPRLISIFLGMIFYAVGVFGMLLYDTLNIMLLHNWFLPIVGVSFRQAILPLISVNTHHCPPPLNVFRILAWPHI